jgi:hypothetical protein
MIDWSDQAAAQEAIARTLDSMKALLLEKNKRYGNSALKPLRIFSKAAPDEGVKIRLDDKLSRIIQSGGDIRKNDAADLMGYLVLFAAAQGWTDFNDLLD